MFSGWPTLMAWSSNGSPNGFARQTIRQSFPCVSPLVARVIRCLADVLPKREPEFRSELFQVAADFAEAVALVVGQGVHRIENQRSHSRAKLAACELPV